MKKSKEEIELINRKLNFNKKVFNLLDVDKKKEKARIEELEKIVKQQKK